MIPMRDGTRLAARVQLPVGADGKPDLTKKYPVVLLRTAYLHSGPSTAWYGLSEYSTAYGYALVEVAARGSERSEGQLQPLANEGWGIDGRPDHNGWGVHKDGADTMAWVVKQPWCSGQIVTSGISWQGASQLLPLLDGDVPGHVTAAISNPAMNSGFGNWGYESGFYTLNLQIMWAMMLLADQLKYHRYAPAIEEEIMKDNALLGDPFSDPRKINGVAWAKEYGLLNMPVLRHIPFWRKWVENYDNIDFFSYNDTTNRPHNFDKPQLFVGGMYDLFLNNGLWAYERAVADAPSKEIAESHRLVITPFNHTSRMFERRYANEDTDQAALNMDWFRQQVEGIPTELFQKGRAFIYIMGEEKWCAEQAWPLPDAAPTEYYLHSGGKANTSGGDGVLSTEKPGAEPTDHYTSDPDNPVVAMQEHSLIGGSNDHSANEQRPDVLCYTTPVLVEDVEVTGWIKATVYAATTATATDFIMKLMDVYPDGRSMNLVTGGIRGRYRKDRRKPEALVPGQVEKFEIAMRATANVFKKGHRIRVELMSSNAGLYDVNPNQFIDLRTCTEKDYVTAEQTIYHDVEHPSSITLPIIPVSHKREWLDWPYSPEKTGGFDHAAQTGKPPCTEPIELNAVDLPVVY